jgi:hypothetical protein
LLSSRSSSFRDFIDIPINLTSTNYTVIGAARYVTVGGRTFSGKNNNWLINL